MTDDEFLGTTPAHVQQAAKRHPNRVQHLRHEDGTRELRIAGDGYVYNFASRRFVVTGSTCRTVPRDWRYIEGQEANAS